MTAHFPARASHETVGMLRVVTDDYVMLHAKVPFGLRTPLTADALRVDLTYDTRAPYAIHCAPRDRGRRRRAAETVRARRVDLDRLEGAGRARRARDPHE